MRAPVIALTHGGGPMPILNDPGHKEITRALKTKVPEILRLGTPEQPRAIIVVTAHWETDIPNISSGKTHELLYDYYGFPPEAYTLKYDAPGNPEVAEQIQGLLKKAGIESKMDPHRGWDHGVFIPLTLIHPAATIPVVQMSVLESQSALALYDLGRALAPLRDQNVAIICSGSASAHNRRAWKSGEASTSSYKAKQREWATALDEAVKEDGGEKRRERLGRWREFPASYDMHPHGASEHFSPLVVAAGAGGDGVAGGWEDDWVGLGMMTYYWN